MVSIRIAAPVALACLVAFLFVWAGCVKRGEESPKATFEKALDYVEAGDYGKVWALHTDEGKQILTRGYQKHQQITKTQMGTSNEATYRRMIETQYGVSVEEFLRLRPHEIDRKKLETQRDHVLKLRVEGDARINGNRATLLIAYPEEYTPPAEWLFELTDGRWLIVRGAETPGEDG